VADTTIDAAGLGPLAFTSSATARGRRPPRDSRKTAPYAFIAPFLVLFAGLYLIPIGYAIVQALYTTKSSGLGLGVSAKTTFDGVGNFVTVLSGGAFWDGIGRVLLFGIVQVPVMMIIAIALALILDSGLVRLRRLFRFAMFLPYAVPAVIAAILWSFLYFPSLSPLVPVIHHLGAGSFNFLGDHTVLWSIANIVTWEWTGYDMLIFIAALQSIPTEYYEAARVEGASEWRIATRIKLPLIGPALGLSAVFSIIGTLQLFNEPTVLQPLTRSVTSNFTPNMYAYAEAFTADNYHEAAAIAVALAAVTFIFSFALLGFLSKRQALQ